MKKLKEIKKKTWTEYFEKILAGEKKFELRLADFDIEPGDILILEEYNPQTKEYTGRTIKKKVNYVINTKSMEEIHSKEEIDQHGFYILQMEDTE